MRIRPVGAHALLIDCADADQVQAWWAELWRRREHGELTAVEIVPAATTVLLDGLPDPVETAARIAAWTPGPPTPTPTGEKATVPGQGTVTGQAVAAGGAAAGGTGGGEDVPAVGGTVEVPVTFDGADLPVVASHWGVDVPTVVDRLGRTPFQVAFCGFAPGFAYLTGLPAELAVPRLPSPRPRVPAGSVALAGPYAGIYPAASPGGWLLVGHTDLVLFDVRADPPARLAPGTRVRLVPA
ncbi:5-oxoprolinase subunit B family protein [Micromonospora sp. KLBMP9576]|uniref:5-oxoprolinase subunit B family protein n=1 Tax=Micromonospora sp. KLBMP9576 TaxID=3424769 RepID=UPI003D8B7F65